MSTLITRTIQTPDNTPVSFPNGIRIGAATGSGALGSIGTAGQQGFGVGIVSNDAPTGFSKFFGTNDPSSDAWGNYQHDSDGSIMCCVPLTCIKYGTGANGLAINEIDCKPFSYFDNSNTIANAAGYFVDRAFYNAGAIRPGFMYDKYKCSLNGNIASSVKNGIVLSSAVRGSLTTSVFASCTGNGQTPANNFSGSIAAARSRGNQFFPHTAFMRRFLYLLSLAHGAAASSSAYCGWYDPSFITNFPKGNNNNALGDANDNTILYLTDGNGTYPGCGKTGSANFFSKTTHNGQNCGIADVNGLVGDVEPFGITSDGVSIYLLNTSADVTAMTAGNTLAGDVWGATALASSNYTNVGATYGALLASNTQKTMGSATQVFSEATSGTAWGMAAAGVPLVGGIGGANKFGNDGFWDYRPNELCAAGGANWSNGATAGPGARFLVAYRAYSVGNCGLASACFLQA